MRAMGSGKFDFDFDAARPRQIPGPISTGSLNVGGNRGITYRVDIPRIYKRDRIGDGGASGLDDEEKIEGRPTSER